MNRLPVLAVIGIAALSAVAGGFVGWKFGRDEGSDDAASDVASVLDVLPAERAAPSCIGDRFEAQRSALAEPNDLIAAEALLAEWCGVTIEPGASGRTVTVAGTDDVWPGDVPAALAAFGEATGCVEPADIDLMWETTTGVDGRVASANRKSSWTGDAGSGWVIACVP